MDIIKKINNCFDCDCLDDADAFNNKYYCDHQDTPRTKDGKFIEFSAKQAMDIPKWCPYKKRKK